jgi:SnoaL-like domain
MKNIFKKNNAIFIFVIGLALLNCNCTNSGKDSHNQKIIKDSLAQQIAQDSTERSMIKDYYAAYEKKDWSLIAPILADGFTFSSPAGDNHINLKTYKEKCWPNSKNTKKFDLEEIVFGENDAYVTYNGWTTDGRLFRNTELFKFKDGKIISNECFFGPGVNFPNNTKK